MFAQSLYYGIHMDGGRFRSKLINLFGVVSVTHMEATCAVMALVPELVKALNEQPDLGFGITYYISVNHPELEYTHSNLVQLAHALAELHPGAYIVDGLASRFEKCTETSVTHVTDEESRAVRKAQLAEHLAEREATTAFMHAKGGHRSLVDFVIQETATWVAEKTVAEAKAKAKAEAEAKAKAEAEAKKELAWKAMREVAEEKSAAYGYSAEAYTDALAHERELYALDEVAYMVAYAKAKALAAEAAAATAYAEDVTYATIESAYAEADEA